MNTDLYNPYFNYFTSCFSKRLKAGWGIRMTIYPFNQGAVIVITMKKGVANSLDKKQESRNLGGALTKTSLFSSEKINPIAEKTIGNTSYGIISITQYVMFKSDKSASWSEAAARGDIDNIIEKTRARYGK